MDRRFFFGSGLEQGPSTIFDQRPSLVDPVALLGKKGWFISILTRWDELNSSSSISAIRQGGCVFVRFAKF